MRAGPGDSFSAPPHFDRKNFAVGAVMSSLLVGLLGYGTIVLFQANTPREEGVNLTGAMLATFGCLFAVALGAAFTARRGRRGASQPMPEGISAGLAGFLLAIVGAGYVFFVVRDIPLLEMVNLLPLLLPGAGAAVAGAALGSRRRDNGPTP